MAKHRTALPQLNGRLFLTDGGMETTLIFHDGVDLPHFAAVALLRTREGRAKAAAYYERYIALAQESRTGFVLESPTWRASPDWGAKLGLTLPDLADLNRDAIALMEELRAKHETAATPMVISGNIGPRGDGYDPGQLMSVEAAQDYHSFQMEIFATSAADMAAAFTMTNVNEAIGIARAALACRLPIAISFTLETDGRLPTGESLKDAILQTDRATGDGPAYYMINCAHPTHFADTLAEGGAWTERIRGLRANASRRSHQELNDSPDLDAGDPVEFGAQHRELIASHPRLSVLGGCCGTDHRHVARIAMECRDHGGASSSSPMASGANQSEHLPLA